MFGTRLEPPVTNAGCIIVRPTVTIYGEELTTKCGKTGSQCLLLHGRSAGLLQQLAATGSADRAGRISGQPTS